jgi:hypothetical protein
MDETLTLRLPQDPTFQPINSENGTLYAGRNILCIRFCEWFPTATAATPSSARQWKWLELLVLWNLKKMNDGLRRRVMDALAAVAMDTIKGTIAGWRPHDAKEHALYCEAVSELAKCLKGQDNIGASSG